MDACTLKSVEKWIAGLNPDLVPQHIKEAVTSGGAAAGSGLSSGSQSCASEYYGHDYKSNPCVLPSIY